MRLAFRHGTWRAVSFIRAPSVDDLVSRGLQIICPSQPSHEIYNSGRRIEKAILRGLIVPRKAMMIIVPTLTGGKDGHHVVVRWFNISGTRRKGEKFRRLIWAV